MSPQPSGSTGGEPHYLKLSPSHIAAESRPKKLEIARAETPVAPVAGTEWISTTVSGDKVPCRLIGQELVNLGGSQLLV